MAGLVFSLNVNTKGSGQGMEPNHTRLGAQLGVVQQQEALVGILSTPERVQCPYHKEEGGGHYP